MYSMLCPGRYTYNWLSHYMRKLFFYMLEASAEPLLGSIFSNNLNQLSYQQILFTAASGVRRKHANERRNQPPSCTFSKMYTGARTGGRLMIVEASVWPQQSLVFSRDQDLALDVNHVKPSYRPSPVVAHDGCTYQLRSRIRVSPSFSCISWGFIAAK